MPRYHRPKYAIRGMSIPAITDDADPPRGADVMAAASLLLLASVVDANDDDDDEESAVEDVVT